MINDENIIKRAQTWFKDSDRQDLSIVSEDNGRLVNTENKFENNSLELDNSVGLKESIIQLFEYSGLPQDQQDSYQITEPTAFLLKGNGIENENPFIQTINPSGLKLSDNLETATSKNYENEQIVLNKLYSTDTGQLKDGSGHDIPIREIMNSTDSITFTSQQEDIDKNRRKKLFIIGTSPKSENVNMSQNCIQYINNILNYNSIIPNVSYHGECEFFKNYKLFSDGSTINDLCNGNFIANKYSELIPQSSDNTKRLRFRRDLNGWKLLIYENGQYLNSINFKSITKRMSDYPEGSLPLPVQNELFPNDVIKWTTSYKPNIDALKLFKIGLQVKSDLESSEREILINNWSILRKEQNSKDLVYIQFSSDLIDTNNQKLNLSDNYRLRSLKFYTENSYDNISIIRDIPIDKDPFNGKILLPELLKTSIGGNSNV